MKLNMSKKAAIAVGAGAIAVAASGVAYAFYTTSISGTSATGGATVSSTGASNLTTALQTAATGLVPGGQQSLVIRVTNPNSYNVELSSAKNLHLAFPAAAVTCGLSAPDVAAPTAVIAGGGHVDVTFTVSMLDSSGSDQTSCQSASYDIPVTVV